MSRPLAARPSSPSDAVRTPADMPVRDVTRQLGGCIRENHVQDVLDVLDALDLGFMPVVTDFGDTRVVAVVTRSELEWVLKRHGSGARVAQASTIALPVISGETPVGRIGPLAGRAPACVITRDGGCLVGIYVSEPADD